MVVISILKDFLYNGDFEGNMPNVVACTDRKIRSCLGRCFVGYKPARCRPWFLENQMSDGKIIFSQTEPTQQDYADGIYDRRDNRILPDGRMVRKWTDGKWRAFTKKGTSETINVVEDQGKVNVPDLILLDRKTA